MPGSRSVHWQMIRAVENALGYAHSVEDHCYVAAMHAWHEASWEVAYVELVKAIRDCDRMRKGLKELRKALEEKGPEGP